MQEQCFFSQNMVAGFLVPNESFPLSLLQLSKLSVVLIKNQGWDLFLLVRLCPITLPCEIHVNRHAHPYHLA